MESDESNTKRVTVRVPKSLVDEYDGVLDDRGENRSQAIRRHMRKTVKTPVTDGGLEPPQDDETLAKAYIELRQLAASGQSIPLKEVQTVLASKMNLQKASIPRRVIKPLKERGYLSRAGDPINEPHVVVR